MTSEILTGTTSALIDDSSKTLFVWRSIPNTFCLLYCMTANTYLYPLRELLTVRYDKNRSRSTSVAEIRQLSALILSTGYLVLPPTVSYTFTFVHRWYLRWFSLSVSQIVVQICLKFTRSVFLLVVLAELKLTSSAAKRKWPEIVKAGVVKLLMTGNLTPSKCFSKLLGSRKDYKPLWQALYTCEEALIFFPGRSSYW